MFYLYFIFFPFFLSLSLSFSFSLRVAFRGQKRTRHTVVNSHGVTTKYEVEIRDPPRIYAEETRAIYSARHSFSKRPYFRREWGRLRPGENILATFLRKVFMFVRDNDGESISSRGFIGMLH